MICMMITEMMTLAPVIRSLCVMVSFKETNSTTRIVESVTEVEVMQVFIYFYHFTVLLKAAIIMALDNIEKQDSLVKA